MSFGNYLHTSTQFVKCHIEMDRDLDQSRGKQFCESLVMKVTGTGNIFEIYKLWNF